MLVERILEYKRFKKAAEILAMQEERSQRIFEKPQEDISQYLDNPDEYLSLDLKQFAGAFNLFIQKKQKVEAVRKHYTKIERERATMEGRIRMILNAVRSKLGQIFSFRDMVKNKEDRYDVVVTFMSLLEMAKERVIHVDQKALYGDIEISAGERISEDTVLDKYQSQEVQEA
jgi:segregation and condensation protein A